MFQFYGDYCTEIQYDMHEHMILTITQWHHHHHHHRGINAAAVPVLSHNSIQRDMR